MGQVVRRIGVALVIAVAFAAAVQAGPREHHRIARCIRGCEHQLTHCVRTSHTGPERAACGRENQICQKDCRTPLH